MNPPPSRATRREWIGLAIIALPCLVYAMDLTVLNLAVPAISASLSPTASQLLWIIDIYGFFVAGFLITMGTLGDRIGRRRLLLIGAGAFAAASVVAAYSTSVEMLIAMRALLGIAGATLAPSTLSLIRNMFHDEEQRRFAIGVWIASFSAGGLVGPVVGGLVIEWFHWGAVFLVAVPVMLATLLLGPKLLPEYKDANAGRVDAPSVALSLAAVLTTIFGLKQLAEGGASPVSVGAIAAGLALGTTFVRRQGRLAYPLLDLSLFRRRAFAASISAYALCSLAMFGVYIYITQYLQLVLGLSPLMAGIATVPWSLAFLVGSLVSPRLARGRAPSRLMVAGLAVAALGFVMTAAIDHQHGLAVLVAATVVISLGMSPVMTLGNELIITSAPPQRAGAASAISETSAELSGALGIALFGTFGMWLYRAGLGGAAGGLSAEALATLGGTLDAARGMGGRGGAELAAAARASFLDAMQWVGLTGAVIVAVAAALAARIFRGGGPAQTVVPESGPSAT